MFNYGTLLRIQGVAYEIVGVIQFQSTTEKTVWEEYRMFNTTTSEEMWLSYDDYNAEYSMSRVSLTSKRNIDPHFQGYHIVDQGSARVILARGNVDVDQGEKVDYIELEDMSEDRIKSIEIWEDESELSEGYYIEKSDIVPAGKPTGTSFSNTKYSSASGNAASSCLGIFIILSVVLFIFAIIAVSLTDTSPSIADYLKSSTNYTYSTSVTSNINPEEKADVYSTSLSIDQTAKDIIQGIEGNTQSIQQNTEDDDNSIAIMTKNEYCLIYEDSETNATLVQVSTRLYVYTSDSDPYHSRYSSSRYFRRYYYTKGYSSDRSSYGDDYASSYNSFNDSAVSDNSTADTYNNYSKSVRQASAAARSSSGGGTSSGK